MFCDLVANIKIYVCYVGLLDIAHITGKNGDLMSKNKGLLYDGDLLVKVLEYNRDRYQSFTNGHYVPINKDYERILKARYQKSSRIKRRMVYLFSRYKYIWFCTFTFSKKYINKSTRTKRDLIKSCIDIEDFKFILNIDYGKSTQREHYHCILATNKNININDLFQSVYKGGFCLSILCNNSLDDFSRLKKYIDKLINHCIKASTKKQRLLYNFKGYDIFPDSTYSSLLYFFDYSTLFDRGYENLCRLNNNLLACQEASVSDTP